MEGRTVGTKKISPDGLTAARAHRPTVVATAWSLRL